MSNIKSDSKPHKSPQSWCTVLFCRLQSIYCTTCSTCRKAGPLVKMHRSLQCYNSWYPLYTCHYINGLCSFLKDCILIYEGKCCSMYFYFCCSFGTILALTRRSFICCTVPFKPYKVCIYTKQPTLDEEKSVRYFKRTGVQS